MPKKKTSRRIIREKKTVAVMIGMYCSRNHQTADGHLCRECHELKTYALRRADNCPFSFDKPVCNKCPVHCYKPKMRERIREVMRYAGPRILKRHPVLAIMHIIDGHRTKNFQE